MNRFTLGQEVEQLLKQQQQQQQRVKRDVDYAGSRITLQHARPEPSQRIDVLPSCLLLHLAQTDRERVDDVDVHVNGGPGAPTHPGEPPLCQDPVRDARSE